MDTIAQTKSYKDYSLESHAEAYLRDRLGSVYLNKIYNFQGVEVVVPNSPDPYVEFSKHSIRFGAAHTFTKELLFSVRPDQVTRVCSELINSSIDKIVKELHTLLYNSEEEVPFLRPLEHKPGVMNLVILFSPPVLSQWEEVDNYWKQEITVNFSVGTKKFEKSDWTNQRGTLTAITQGTALPSSWSEFNAQDTYVFGYEYGK